MKKRINRKEKKEISVKTQRKNWDLWHWRVWPFGGTVCHLVDKYHGKLQGAVNVPTSQSKERHAIHANSQPPQSQDIGSSTS